MIWLAVLAAARFTAVPAPERHVAITIDDLPGVSVVGGDLAAFQAMTEKLLGTLRASGAPAIGFVNEGKLAPEGVREKARVALLASWIDAGMELGNHTYSHFDLHRRPLDEFERDTVLGEEVTRPLLGERGRKLRYFRHPFLHTGRDLEVKRGLEAFLAARGYVVAPVTHDNAEWIFARAYANAGNRRDAAAQRRVVEAYIPYMEAKFDYFERQARKLFSREIPQVLLIHANSLNADTFGNLAAMMKSRGYAFIPLAQALEDPAYRSPDTFTGPGGITWLHRWALSRGGDSLVLPDEPRTPAFVLEIAGVDSE